jgi:hypothetical protein
VNVIRTRLHVAPDGTVTGHVPETVPPGDHDADIVLHPMAGAVDGAQVRVTIRALQEELARLPVVDARPADEILGYDETGLFR